MVMNNFLNQSVAYIVMKCNQKKIGDIVIGDWKGMKRGLKMQKKTAQNFQQIPYRKFMDKLKSKCERYGITYQNTDESD